MAKPRNRNSALRVTYEDGARVTRLAPSPITEWPIGRDELVVTALREFAIAMTNATMDFNARMEFICTGIRATRSNDGVLSGHNKFKIRK